MSDSRLVVARRELAGLSREKTIVLALLIQLFVAGFSSFLVVGLTSLYDPSSVSGGGVAVAATGDATDELLDAAAATGGLDVATYEDTGAATAAFRRGEVDAVVVARTTEQRRIDVTVTAPARSLRKTLIVVQIREALEALERRERRERAEYLEHVLVPLPEAPDASPYFAFSYTVLVPLLVFLPVFISGSIAVDAVTEEAERGTLELLRVAPLSLGDVVTGKGLAAAVLAPVQAALWFALLSFNGIAVANWTMLVLLAAALAVGLVAVGLGLGVAVADRQRAQLLYSLAALAAFTAAALLPQHPSTTIARLAVGSATTGTYLAVAGYCIAAVATVVVVGRLVARTPVETL